MKPWMTAILTAAVLIAAAGLAAYIAHETNQTRLRAAMLERMAGADTALRDRLTAYTNTLIGAEGFFKSEAPTREQWREFVARALASKTQEGVRGIHFAPRIAQANYDAHLAQARADGFETYALRPPGGNRAEYYPVFWPEPLDERNRRVLGVDMYAEPVRREAIRRARETSRPAMSGRVVLAGETTRQAPGFLLYLPIYAPGGNLQNAAERERGNTGMVFTPVRMEDLMKNILTGPLEGLHLEIYDGEVATRDAWMYLPETTPRAPTAEQRIEQRAPHAATRRFEYGGRTWTLYVEPGARLSAEQTIVSPRTVLIGGVILALLAAVGAGLWAARRQPLPQ